MSTAKALSELFDKKQKRTLKLFALGVVGLTATQTTQSVELLRHRGNSNSTMRLHAFVDDSGLESLDRTRQLASQNPTLPNRSGNDVRDLFFRDALHYSASDHRFVRDLAAPIGQNLVENLLPEAASFLNSDFTQGGAPLLLVTQIYSRFATLLRGRIGQIESQLGNNSGVRNITFVLAPWEKNPLNPRENDWWSTTQKFSPHQLGFDPRIQSFQKNWTTKEHLIERSAASMGNLGTRFAQFASANTIMPLEGITRYDTRRNYSVPPYVYPLGLLVNLKIRPGRSELKVQLMAGLQPLLQSMPPQNSNGVTINNAGVPIPMALAPNDPTLKYPFVLATLDQDIRTSPNPLPMHVEFGDFKAYHPIDREFQLDMDRRNRRYLLAPYLGGIFSVGIGNSPRLEIPIRIHITELVLDVSPSAIVARNLHTALEIFDVNPGQLSTGLTINLDTGAPTDQAAQGIQSQLNTQIAQALTQARTQSRERALRDFPLAALFISQPQNNRPASPSQH